MIKSILQWACMAAMLFMQVTAVSAQSGPLPVYVVQPGDTLTVIAYRFGVDMQDLIDVNNIADPGAVGAGARLAIPGLEGVEGVLNAQTVTLGENLTSLSRRHRFPMDQLVRLNRITSPTEIFAGASVIVPELESSDTYAGMASLNKGQSLLDLSASSQLNPWMFALANGMDSTQLAEPGELLFFPSAQPDTNFTPVSPLVTAFEVTPLPVAQGGTVTVRLTTSKPMQLNGSLNGVAMHFFPIGQQEYVALQGVHAMADPGLTTFAISGMSDDGSQFAFEQSMLLKPGYFAEDPPLDVDPATIDPATTRPEEDLVRQVISETSEERAWDGVFRRPVDDPWCIKSWFGNRRAYNSSDYSYFHTGVDYGVCANLNIYAPAPGKVVFAGPLSVRGNATIIDHGWGVLSGIWHQSSLAVKKGDIVEAGQLIGEIGATGRVTGPHLHWEIWVNGIQVEPIDWLDNAYPPEAAD